LWLEYVDHVIVVEGGRLAASVPRDDAHFAERVHHYTDRTDNA
jgi:hypothetical protein